MAVVVAAAGAVVDAQDEDERVRLARLIRQRVEQLNTLEQKIDAESRRHASEIRRIDDQINRLNSQLAPISRELKQSEARLEEQRSAIQSANAIRQTIANQLRQLTVAARPAMQDLNDRIRFGIPFQVDARIERAAAVSDGIDADDPVAQATAFGDLWTIVGEELQLAGTRTYWNEAVMLEGDSKRVNAYQFRLGLVQQLFVSEDGTRAGFAGRDTNGWRVVEPARQIDAAINTLDVARGQAPPELISVPFNQTP